MQNTLGLYNHRNADNRSLPEKAIGLIYAMTDDQALELQRLLRSMRARSAIDRRAEMFVGGVEK